MCPNINQTKQNPSTEIDAKIILSSRNSSTLLLTVLVKIINKDRSLIIRGLFDTGAQRSFIKKDIVYKLGLEPVDQEMLSHGFMGASETKQKSHNVYNITLQSLCSNFRLNISVLDEKKICGAIPRVSNPEIFPILKRKNIELSDTGEDTPEIDLLIGADYLGVLLTGSIKHIDKNLVAIKTKLGWKLQGKQTKQSKSLENIIYVDNLDLTELWSLDAICIRDPVEIKSRQVVDEEIVEFFRKTIKRNDDKRYEVCLPWKSGYPELESNKELATKRLMSTTKNLIRSGHLSEYDEVFNEWIREKTIEIVDEDKNKGHYLPHHPVIKTVDTTTKIRPVFYASAKDSKGNCLNNCLEKGPNLLELVPKLIRQFRKNSIGISDIKKAFLQISLNPKDRDYFKFLWWKVFSRRNELITLRHCRVVFDASPRPLLLEATIAHHLENVSDGRKETTRQLQKSFYVDNCITSLETREKAAKFISEAKELMSAAKFDLRDCQIILHCFSDASEVSYAACIFLRAEYNGKVSVQSVASKSRVSPTKKITIPRLELGDEEENFKCPVLLPGNHEIIRRLIHQKHCELQHAGLRTLISNLRENYWIISVNKIAKRVSSHCITCKRFKVRPTEPPVAPLPKNTIKVAAEFEVAGIDLAGPLFLRSGEETWIALFTCAIYRAVHLELVNS
ncbi:uncharacterized protein LOC129959174 [Argiope bruennichi]|uniref:uncharacterized protein LOC129959174 n=1 Tax=Argiope bruennichi TaxID=94029 RepID=UPI002495578C|nr:uncharacterized protein LOC129959174 [Argiope bruennichi]